MSIFLKDLAILCFLLSRYGVYMKVIIIFINIVKNYHVDMMLHAYTELTCIEAFDINVYSFVLWFLARLYKVQVELL